MFPIYEKFKIKCPYQRDNGPRDGYLKPYSFSGPNTESCQAQMTGESSNLSNKYKLEINSNSDLRAFKLLQYSTLFFVFVCVCVFKATDR